MARPKIYANLEKSEFTFETEKYKFYFSSKFYLTKFADEILAFRKKVKDKFTTLYLMPVELNDYADIVYYNKVEKRGFHIVSRETKEVINWVGNIILDGRIRTNRNFKE